MQGKWLVVCVLLLCGGINEANDKVKWSLNFAGILTRLDLLPELVVESGKTQMVTQCAAKCLRKTNCQLFVYEDASKTCKLSNTPINDVTASDKTQRGNSTIYPRSAFSINLDSVDACTTVHCQNGGICALKDSAPQGFLCYCKNGYTGRYCQTADEKPQWAAWSDWSACSTTCDIGYRYSSRVCRFLSNDSVVERNRCDGQDARVEMCKIMDCPRWTTWTAWSPCTTHFTCGDGNKLRHRTCSDGRPNVDAGCIGIAQEEKPCQSPSCSLNAAPVRLVGSPTVGIGIVEIYDDQRQTWGQVCSDNFNEAAGKIVCKNLGFQDLFEVRSAPSVAAASTPFVLKNLRCSSVHQTLQECRHDGWNSTVTCSRGAEIACVVNGGWSQWTSWSKCSVTCGAGERARSRSCDHPQPSNGENCPGTSTERKTCDLPACPVDGYWQPWTKWSSCNVTCGGGISYRDRKCIPPKYDGKPCEGAPHEAKTCNTFHCPVDGYFTKWTEWTPCNVTCGGGLQHRSRTCVPPKYNGRPCDGETSQTRRCNTQNCPVDGYWLPWTKWSTCNVSCGGGSQFRTRKCNEPKYGGKPCTGISKTIQECNTQHCPIDGKWKKWSEWTHCTKSCGNGTRTRVRVCEGPLYGGKFCAGPSNETNLCNTFHCPVDGIWLDWTTWTPCTKSCGSGTSTRNRTCVGPYYGGKTCKGDSDQVNSCNTAPCPVPGVWRDWTPWSSCSTTCSQGVERRRRSCIPPKHGGQDCQGPSKEEQKCNLGQCPLPGQWSEWGAWSDCSVTCRQGTRKRFRACVKVVVSAPLAGCNGTDEEIDICNDFPCLPNLQSCSAWKEAGMIGNYVEADIDPTNNKMPIRVKCNLTGTPEGETIVDNTLNKETKVGSFENPGMNVLTPIYANSDNFRSVVALVEKSASCRQFVKIRCKGSSIHTMLNSKTTDMMSWWTNRYGEKMTYWGGSDPVHGNCACSIHNNCVWKNLTCNCDANDDVWRSDEGFITYKQDLPVKSLCIGDTGGKSEEAIVKLGPLVCKG